MTEKTQILKVEEFYNDDMSRGCARIDYSFMDKLGVSTGHTIEISGKRKTVVKCKPLYVSDEGKAIIRMDKFTKKNMGADIGDQVTIRKIDSTLASRIIVMPLKDIPEGTEGYVADALDGVPVMRFDELFVPYFDEGLLYKVVDVEPEDVVVINPKTKIVII